MEVELVFISFSLFEKKKKKKERKKGCPTLLLL